MGAGSGGGGAPWIFIHDIDKVEGGLMVLFFGFGFSEGPLLEIFLPTLLIATCHSDNRLQWHIKNGCGNARK